MALNAEGGRGTRRWVSHTASDQSGSLFQGFGIAWLNDGRSELENEVDHANRRASHRHVRYVALICEAAQKGDSAGGRLRRNTNRLQHNVSRPSQRWRLHVRRRDVFRPVPVQRIR